MSTRLPEPVEKWIKKRAKEEGRKPSDILRRLILKWFYEEK